MTRSLMRKLTSLPALAPKRATKLAKRELQGSVIIGPDGRVLDCSKEVADIVTQLQAECDELRDMLATEQEQRKTERRLFRRASKQIAKALEEALKS